MKDRPTKLYKLLRVPVDATPERIKESYRKLAFSYHPDRNPGDATAAKRFREVTEAYEVLSNPSRRAHYDATGEILASGPDRKFMPYVVEALAETVQQINKAGLDVLIEDVVGHMISFLTDKLTKVLEIRQSFETDRESLEKVVGRVKTDEETNQLADLIRGQIRDLDDRIKKVTEAAAMIEEASEFVKRYRYEKAAKRNQGFGFGDFIEFTYQRPVKKPTSYKQLGTSKESN